MCSLSVFTTTKTFGIYSKMNINSAVIMSISLQAYFTDYQRIEQRGCESTYCDNCRHFVELFCFTLDTLTCVICHRIKWLKFRVAQWKWCYTHYEQIASWSAKMIFHPAQLGSIWNMHFTNTLYGSKNYFESIFSHSKHIK